MVVKKILITILLTLFCSNAFAVGSTTIRARISDDAVREVWMDKSTRAMTTIDYPHHEVHNGRHYSVSGFTTLEATQDIEFVTATPNTTRWAHMFFAITATGKTSLTVYEDCTAADDGTQITPINSNRNSSNTADIIVSQDPTMTYHGPVIYTQKFGFVDTPSKSRGGEDRAEFEFILKQNSKYLWSITSDNNANSVSYLGYFYEHTDKDPL